MYPYIHQSIPSFTHPSMHPSLSLHPPHPPPQLVNKSIPCPSVHPSAYQFSSSIPPAIHPSIQSFIHLSFPPSFLATLTRLSSSASVPMVFLELGLEDVFFFCPPVFLFCFSIACRLSWSLSVIDRRIENDTYWQLFNVTVDYFEIKCASLYTFIRLNCYFWMILTHS